MMANRTKGRNDVSDAYQVDTSQLFQHAANVRAVRDQLTAIKGASSAISQDDSAYGLLCGWISAILERRHSSQNEFYTRLCRSGRREEPDLSTAAEELASVEHFVLHSRLWSASVSGS
jgi:hypothetical protein